MGRAARPEMAEAIQMLREGVPVTDVANDLGVPLQTVHSWRRRYVDGNQEPAGKRKPMRTVVRPKKPGPTPELDDGWGWEVEGVDDAADEPADEGDEDGDGWQVQPTELAGMGAADFLADRVAFGERILQRMWSQKAPPWSSFGTVMKAQAELHGKLIEVVRSEGTRLDLSEDPRAIAAAISQLSEELRVLGLDLDDLSTLVTREDEGDADPES